MQFSQARIFSMHRTWNDRKVPLTCREHVNHVSEGHYRIAAPSAKILEDSNCQGMRIFSS